MQIGIGYTTYHICRNCSGAECDRETAKLLGLKVNSNYKVVLPSVDDFIILIAKKNRLTKEQVMEHTLKNQGCH